VSFMEHVLKEAAAEREKRREEDRKKVEDALRAFLSECCPGGRSLPEGGDAADAAAPRVRSYGGIRMRSRAWGILDVFRKILSDTGGGGNAGRLKKAFLSGMGAAAVFPSSLQELCFVTPERWFGRRGIVNALRNLGLLARSGAEPSLLFQAPLLFRYGGSGRKAGAEFFVRLCLTDGRRRIAIENVSNDLGGLIRAREFISNAPPGSLRDTVMVILINDDLTLSDGTPLTAGSFLRDETGKRYSYTDADPFLGAGNKEDPAGGDTSGNPLDELLYYGREAGKPFLPGEGALLAAEGLDRAAAERAVSVIRKGEMTEGVREFISLPLLAGTVRDYVFVTYSQFLSAAAGFREVPFTLLCRGGPAYFRTGESLGGSGTPALRPYRRKPLRTDVTDYDLDRDRKRPPGSGRQGML
ncbi:MAG: hypothetical protein IJT00_10525, partial [Lachnospiraceae bacterium]|nr:hypothetical protein [Lachnospiraceae bacterium]